MGWLANPSTPCRPEPEWPHEAALAMSGRQAEYFMATDPHKGESVDFAIADETSEIPELGALLAALESDPAWRDPRGIIWTAV